MSAQPYTLAFVEAVYGEYSALALASFSEKKCLEDATVKLKAYEAALKRIAAYSAGLTPIPGDPIEIARTALSDFSEHPNET